MAVYTRAALFAVGAFFLLSSVDALALPSFARDSKVSCFSCHYKSAAEYVSRSALSGKEKDLITFTPKEKVKAGIRVYGDALKAPGKEKMVQMSFSGVKGDRAPSQVAGFSGYVGTDLFQASFGWLNPKAGPMFLDTNKYSDSELWYRLAVTPSAGGVDFSVGVIGYGGSEAKEKGAILRLGGGLDDISIPLVPSSVGIDAGIRAGLDGFYLGVGAMYLTNQGVDINGRKIFNSGGQSSYPDTFSANAQLGFGQDFGLSASYSVYTQNDHTLSESSSAAQEKSASIGAWLKINDRIRIMPEYTIYGPDKEWLDKGTGEFYLRFFTGF